MVSVSIRLSDNDLSRIFILPPSWSCVAFPICEFRVLTDAISLCFVVIIGLPAATPKEYINTASFALGNFSNGLLSSSVLALYLIPFA